MWTYKEKWIGNKILIYLSDFKYFGFRFEISTCGISILIGWFGFEIWFD